MFTCQPQPVPVVQQGDRVKRDRLASIPSPSDLMKEGKLSCMVLSDAPGGERVEAHLFHHTSKALARSFALGSRSGASKKSIMKSYRAENLYPSYSGTQFGASDKLKMS